MDGSTKDRLRAALLRKRGLVAQDGSSPPGNDNAPPSDDGIPFDGNVGYGVEPGGGAYIASIDQAFMAMASDDVYALSEQLEDAAQTVNTQNCGEMSLLFSMQAYLADELLLLGEEELAEEALAKAFTYEEYFFSHYEYMSAEGLQFRLDAGHVYYDLGLDDLALDRFESAFQYASENEDLPGAEKRMTEAAYMIACLATTTGSQQEALDWLGISLGLGVLDLQDEDGYDMFDPAGDPDLDPIKCTMEWAELRDIFEF